jgi:hypothetical protein
MRALAWCWVVICIALCVLCVAQFALRVWLDSQ